MGMTRKKTLPTHDRLNFDPKEIADLKENNPEKYWEFIEKLRAVTPLNDAQEALKRILRAKVATGINKEAWEAYYELIHGGKIAEHNMDANDKIFQAHENGEPFLFLGFRGCRKTTTFGITFCTWLLGNVPDGTGIVTGASDSNAKINASAMALIIEFHPEFKQCFPHVVPKDKKWGADGYWLIDTRMSREKWEQKQAKTPDPSFIGGGYKSASINGKHPSLFLLPDDLHDIDSSQSPKEREYIKLVFFTQIMKACIRKNDKLVTWVIMTGVPFAEDDTYGEMISTGQCLYVKLPVMRRAPEGQGVHIDGVNPKTQAVYEDIKGWWFLTWPEEFGVKSIISERARGKSSFWQMMMIDIKTAKTAGIKYYLYDEQKFGMIGFNLPTNGGADPTSIDPDTEVGGKKRSSFALCYLSKLPQGGAVVKGGVLKAMGIKAAKDVILQAQSMFTNWGTTGVENVGPGAVFCQYLRLDSSVRFRDSNLVDKQLGNKSVQNKRLRFDNQVAPHLESGLIMISSEESDYNMALRKLCDNFWDIKDDDPALDAGDGLYHAIKIDPSFLRVPVIQNLNPRAINDRGSLAHPMAGGMYG